MGRCSLSCSCFCSGVSSCCSCSSRRHFGPSQISIARWFIGPDRGLTLTLKHISFLKVITADIDIATWMRVRDGELLASFQCLRCANANFAIDDGSCGIGLARVVQVNIEEAECIGDWLEVLTD